MHDGLVGLDQHLPKLKLDRLQMRLEGGKVLGRKASEKLIANG